MSKRTEKPCSVDTCSRIAKSRGLCNAHHKRLMRHGNPLGGRTPDGEPGTYFRDVVLSYEGNECLKWPYSRDEGGHGQVKLNGIQNTVHRAVCLEANGPPPTPKHDAAHSCGNGHDGCCTKRHLSWKTRKENMADKLLHGTHNRGEQHNFSKLKESDIREIRSLRGERLAILAERFGVTRSNICAIQLGKAWKHV